MIEKNILILIVDNHDTIISGIKYELEQIYSTINIRSACNFSEAIEKCKINKFDIVIIEISKEEGNCTDGINFIKEINHIQAKTSIIIYTAYTIKHHFLNSLINLNVDAIVSKDDGNHFLKFAISEMLKGKRKLYSNEICKLLNLEKQNNNNSNIKLTKREVEILNLLHQHFSYKEIADKLFLSKNTIDSHSKNLFKKYNVHKRSELIDKTRSLIKKS